MAQLHYLPADTEIWASLQGVSVDGKEVHIAAMSMPCRKASSVVRERVRVADCQLQPGKFWAKVALRCSQIGAYPFQGDFPRIFYPTKCWRQVESPEPPLCRIACPCSTGCARARAIVSFAPPAAFEHDVLQVWKMHDPVTELGYSIEPRKEH